MNPTSCLNCEHPVSSAQHFCANCGQSVKTHRFTLGHFFHEGFHAFTHADKGLLFLLKELAIRPGVVVKEYLAGKRKKYFNPFTFFFILMGFYVLSDSLKSTDSVRKPVPVEISKITDVEKKKEVMAMYERRINIQTFFKKRANIVAMFAVPIFAFYYWLIYFRKRYNFAEHLVASLLFVSFANLAFSLLVNPLQAIFRGTALAQYVFLLGFVLQWVYLSVAYSGFFNLKGFWATTGIVVSVLVILMFWFFLSLMTTAIYIYQNSHFMEFFNHMSRR